MHDTPTPAGKSQKHHNLTWVDVEAPDQHMLDQLEQEYHLHPVHVQESVQKVQHTQVEHEDGYLFLVLQVPVFNERTDKIMVSQIGIFLGKNYLITVRTGVCPPLSELFEYCQQHADGQAYFEQGPSYLLYVLMSNLLGDMSGMVDKVAAELDDIEDLVFDNNSSDAQRIGKVRQKIVRLGRVLGPQRLVLKDLAGRIDSFAGHHVAKYYSNNSKTAARLWEVIEESKETVEIFKDADFTTSTEQTNEILAVLTIIFTFTIPITVVASLYGMNVPLPGGLATGAWHFWGQYTTFGLVIAVSSSLALAMYVYFHAKKWL